MSSCVYEAWIHQDIVYMARETSKIFNGATERRAYWYASLRLSHHVPHMKETNYQLEPGQDHKISYTLFGKMTTIASCV